MTSDKEMFRARVTSIRKDLWTVTYGEQEFSAGITGQLRKNVEYPVVGDWIFAERDAFCSCMIKKIEERKSVFKRPDRRGHADGYVKTMLDEAIVANFDYVFIISSLNRNFNAGRIARYAAITRSGGGVPVAVLTKADICNDIPGRITEIRNIDDRIDIIPISSYTGESLENLCANTCIAELLSRCLGHQVLENLH